MTKFPVIAALLSLAAAPVAAQNSGLGGLLSGGLPNVAGASAGNAAGLLGYCLKNNLVSGGGAASVLGTLTGKQAVTSSPEYDAGRSGTLLAGGKSLPVGDLKGQLRNRVCGLVLKRARSFAGG